MLDYLPILLTGFNLKQLLSIRTNNTVKFIEVHVSGSREIFYHFNALIQLITLHIMYIYVHPPATCSDADQHKYLKGQSHGSDSLHLGMQGWSRCSNRASDQGRKVIK